MAAPKGNKFGKGGAKPGAGRPKGSQNKATGDMRKAYSMFVQDNIPKFQNWLNRVAKDSPAEALNIVARFSEFCLPKLMRAEVTGEDGATLLPPVIAINFSSGGPGFGGGQLLTIDEDEPAALTISHGAAQSQTS